MLLVREVTAAPPNKRGAVEVSGFIACVIHWLSSPYGSDCTAVKQGYQNISIKEIRSARMRQLHCVLRAP